MTIKNTVLLLVLFGAVILLFQPVSSAPVQPQLQPQPQQFLFPQKVAVLSAETNGLVTNIPFEPQYFVEKDTLLVQLDSDLVDIEIERYQAQIDMDTGIEKAAILLKFRRESLAIAEELYSIIFDNDSEDPNNYMRAGSRKELQEAQQLFEDSELEGIRAQLALQDLHFNVRRFQKNKEQLDIRAPWNGVIVKFTSIKDVPSLNQYKQVEVGEMVQAGQPVIALMKVDTLKVFYKLPVAELPKVKLNQSATVTIRGYESEPIKARVSYINPQVTAGDTVDVEVEFDNVLVNDDRSSGVYRYRFHPGMWATAKLNLDN